MSYSPSKLGSVLAAESISGTADDPRADSAGAPMAGNGAGSGVDGGG